MDPLKPPDTISLFKLPGFSSWLPPLGLWLCHSKRKTLLPGKLKTDSMASLQEYLFISGLLFTIGLTGVLVRRNIIVIFMCLELMLSAANLTLVAFSRFNMGENGLPDYNGQVLVFFIITVAAAEVAVGLAIIVALYRARQTVDVKDLTSMRG